MRSAVLGKAEPNASPPLIRVRAAGRGCKGEITQGLMRQTDLERLADLEAKNTFQHRTLQAIRVVAAKAPPEEAQVALRAIGALAKEALAEAGPEGHEHRAGE